MKYVYIQIHVCEENIPYSIFTYSQIFLEYPNDLVNIDIEIFINIDSFALISKYLY